MGLLLVPEETATPRVLTDAVRFRQDRAGTPLPAGPAALFHEPALLDAHRRMLPPPRRAKDPLDANLLMGLAKASEADSLDEALSGMNRGELAAVLGHAEGLDRLQALAGR
jgi:membrane glycosyltransferase